MKGRRVVRDLVALVADKNIESALCGLLARPEALGIRPVTYAVFVHPEHDPACLRKAAPFLRASASSYRHALVILDREGCGREHCSREELESEIERSVAPTGWSDRVAAVAIDPELENWVWSDSPEVDRALGWGDQLEDVRHWLRGRHFAIARGKPDRPKEALQAVLRQVRKPRSSALFAQLAERVSFDRCEDPAFAKLRAVLATWFSAPADPGAT